MLMRPILPQKRQMGDVKIQNRIISLTRLEFKLKLKKKRVNTNIHLISEMLHDVNDDIPVASLCLQLLWSPNQPALTSDP